jgi:ribosome-interacting GTPase 1
VGRPDPENEDLSWLCKKALLVVTGADQPGSEEDLAVFRELLESPDGEGNRVLWPTFAVSSEDGRGLEELAEASFRAFDVIRVYTKQPGKPADHEKPFTVPRDSTVADLASVIHKDLSHNFKFARLWGKTVFDGQRVQADHELVDEDIIEIHV